MVVAVLVHLDRKEVVPLAIAPIVKQDGETKNDCERNATQRLKARIKQQHPKLKLTVTKDGLSRNSPHINDLRSYGFQFEHNYGHGKQNLSTALATLMMVAFLVDQTRQACCPLFQAVFEQVGRRRSRRERIRSAVLSIVFNRFREPYESILTDRCFRQLLPAP